MITVQISLRLNCYIHCKLLFPICKHFFFSFQHFVNSLHILVRIFYIFYTLFAVFRRKNQLGGGACAAGQDGLKLLHNQNVVNTGLSRGGVAYVFEVAGHVFLAV